MRLKRGVKLNGMSPQILLALMVAEPIFVEYLKPRRKNAPSSQLVVTSVTDSKHGRGSKHYIGNAVDLRTRDLSNDDARSITATLSVRLGAEFDVVLESNHIHIEWDPK